ncbi:MAG: Rpn family recombination-promoting nuclease/putative transposase [Myxococcota bacterium]
MPIDTFDIFDIPENSEQLDTLLRAYSEHILRHDFNGKLKLILEVVFLRVFDGENDHRLLIGLLNALLQLEQRDQIRKVERLETRQLSPHAGDKTPVLDLLVRDDEGRLLHIELQLVGQPDYMARAVFYLTRIHSQQLDAGQDYAELGRSISIHILSWNLLTPVSDWPHPVTQGRLCDTSSGKELSDQLTLVFAELRKFKIPPKELRTDQEKWLYYLKHAERLSHEEVTKMGLKLLNEVDDKLRKVSRSPDLRFASVFEMKERMDAISYQNAWARHYTKSGLEQGRLEGLQQGLQQGLHEGLHQGQAVGRLAAQRESILQILEARFGSVPPPLRTQLEALTEPDQLSALLVAAATTPSLEALFLP